MADLTALDDVVIRVPTSADRRGRSLLQFVSESLQFKFDLVVAVLALFIAIHWGHRAANIGMLAILDVLFGLANWTALFATMTFCPCILMMQAVQSIKFQLYLFAIAVLASVQIMSKHSAAPFVPIRTKNSRLIASSVWAWLSAFALLESIKAGLGPQESVFLTSSLCLLALLASVKSLLRFCPANDYSSL